MTKPSIEERLSVIETDIGYLTKSMDKLCASLQNLSKMEAKEESLESRVLTLESKDTKRDLLIWGALISAIIAMALKDVFL
jgi:hypothetical protein